MNRLNRYKVTTPTGFFNISVRTLADVLKFMAKAGRLAELKPGETITIELGD
jgi:hypothetical protein